MPTEGKTLCQLGILGARDGYRIIEQATSEIVLVYRSIYEIPYGKSRYERLGEYDEIGPASRCLLDQLLGFLDRRVPVEKDGRGLDSSCAEFRVSIGGHLASPFLSAFPSVTV
jgi:hypothetical protein